MADAGRVSALSRADSVMTVQFVVLVLGASGTGTSTLGRHLSRALDCFHADSDSYFWKPTDPPFQEARELAEIQRLLAHDLSSHSHLVLTGSFCSWGDRLETDARLRQSLDAFLEWSRAYDVGGMSRTRQLHEDWMSSLRVPILRMDSGRSVDELTSSSLDFLEI